MIFLSHFYLLFCVSVSHTSEYWGFIGNILRHIWTWIFFFQDGSCGSEGTHVSMNIHNIRDRSTVTSRTPMPMGIASPCPGSGMDVGSVHKVPTKASSSLRTMVGMCVYLPSHGYLMWSVREFKPGTGWRRHSKTEAMTCLLQAIRLLNHCQKQNTVAISRIKYSCSC